MNLISTLVDLTKVKHIIAHTHTHTHALANTHAHKERRRCTSLLSPGLISFVGGCLLEAGRVRFASPQ